MLVDERTISQAEHTGLFFEAANGTTFIVGSPTMGANGDVTNSSVSRRHVSDTFTGHDVRHADGRQLQRVGLQPESWSVRRSVDSRRPGRGARASTHAPDGTIATALDRANPTITAEDAEDAVLRVLHSIVRRPATLDHFVGSSYFRMHVRQLKGPIACTCTSVTPRALTKCRHVRGRGGAPVWIDAAEVRCDRVIGASLLRLSQTENGPV